MKAHCLKCDLYFDNHTKTMKHLQNTHNDDLKRNKWFEYFHYVEVSK